MQQYIMQVLNIGYFAVVWRTFPISSVTLTIALSMMVPFWYHSMWYEIPTVPRLQGTMYGSPYFRVIVSVPYSSRTEPDPAEFV